MINIGDTFYFTLDTSIKCAYSRVTDYNSTIRV